MKTTISILGNFKLLLLASLLVAPTAFASVSPCFSDGHCAISNGEKWGFIDTQGKLKIPFVWDDVRYTFKGQGFQEGLAAVKRNQKWGFISTTGKSAFPKTWDSVESFSEGMAAVQVDGKWGCIDVSGKLVVQAEWDRIGPFSEGLATVHRGDEKGYIDKEGVLVIPLKKESWGFGSNESDSFSHGLALAAKKVSANGVEKTQFGYMDKKGTEVIPMEWDEACKFSEGLALVKKDEKYGFIDASGKIVIPMGAYDTGKTQVSFQHGFARVMKDGKWGFIDKSGKIIIPFQWDIALDFEECGLCAVRNDKGWGFIDRKGHVVIDAVWQNEFYTSFHNGLASFYNNENHEKLGFIDTSGKLVIPFFAPQSDPKQWPTQ